MIKVLIVIGTRPEAIKMAPIIKAMNATSSYVVKVCSTSQHKEMLRQVLEFFRIHVNYDLDVMEPNQNLSSLTSKVILKLSALLKDDRPDWILVQGDTTTAMAAAMAGFYEKIKVAHVEGGLRSFNLDSPFPEEMNRLVISRLASLHFCPTEKAVKNLKSEGVEKNVFNVGNTVVDSVLDGIQLIRQDNELLYKAFFKGIDFDKKIILVTCHRRESFGEPFTNICKAFVEIINRLPDFIIVYPVHAPFMVVR
jgi:UDP-N-acetylglucosamine 2-epimerase (non-hydrolysing)